MTLTKYIEFKTLDSVDGPEKDRIDRLVASFKNVTGIPAEYVIRSPGRINLIGDHIDYHGFSVLPMAIENSILICLSSVNELEKTRLHEQGDQKDPERKELIVLNSDRQYSTFRCAHSFSHGAKLDQSCCWHHYVVCGYHGVLAKELLQLEASQIYKHAKSTVCDEDGSIGSTTSSQLDKKHLSPMSNMIVLVDSDLPPASGLSSSSALVCASALATHLVLWNQRTSGGASVKPSIASEPLAEDCAKFEHLVGTHGGGMDQAVILTAQDGYAKHIEFAPKFRCSNVHLPEGVIWLVSHCGESYTKAATSGFNSRVLETKLAAALVIKRLKPTSELTLDSTLTLSKVKDVIAGSHTSASDFWKIIDKQLFNDFAEMTFDEVGFHLGFSRAELISRFSTSEDFLHKSGLNSRVCLRKRTRHVLEESDRVRQFKLICESTGNLERLGELMTESHTSLRDNYECSHPALDNLVTTALTAGALGARLTGAGWGGCIVSLVKSDMAHKVMRELAKVSKFTFQTEPQSGASIIKVVE